MESLAESMRKLPAMPRFEDAVNAIMDAEADQLCSGGANNRSGYRERNLIPASATSR